jgi:anti-anti-sigma factor
MRHTLTLIGELDRVSAPTLEAEIERICETPGSSITLDLSKLSYIDATGVAVICFRCTHCLRRGHEVALIAGSPSVHRAFERAGAAERLPFIAAEAPVPAEKRAPAPPLPAHTLAETGGSRASRRASGGAGARTAPLLGASRRRGRTRRGRRARRSQR